MNYRDIIDYEHATGNIYKMILGSLDPKYDGETERTVTGGDVGNELLHGEDTGIQGDEVNPGTEQGSPVVGTSSRIGEITSFADGAPSKW
jgi:hypothetical protein